MSLQLKGKPNQEKLYEVVSEFVNRNMEKWLNQTVLRNARRWARAANMPKAFVDNIAIERGEDGYLLVNNWIRDDKPLGIWFEYGTRDHWIEPVNAKVLAWNAPGSAGEHHSSAIYFQSGTSKGTNLFSKGHYVSGLPKMLSMHRSTKSGIQRLRRKIKNEVRRKFSFSTDTHDIKVSI